MNPGDFRRTHNGAEIMRTFDLREHQQEGIFAPFGGESQHIVDIGVVVGRGFGDDALMIAAVKLIELFAVDAANGDPLLFGFGQDLF